MSTNLPALAHDSHRFPRPKDTVGSLTYEPFYGLREKPFSLSSDPRFLYRSPSHAPAFDHLLAGIRRREGLIVLSGEIGTGKTTLCRAVIDSLDRRTFCTFVPDPFVSREDLLKMLLVDFGVMSIDDLKSGRLRDASRPELSYPLYEFLNTLAPLQAFAVLVIDEAQNLPLPLLEEIRILSDLEGREKLLQVVLVGQPELKSHLKLPEMRQVDQRVSVRCELAPLALAEVGGYLAWRLNVAASGNCDTVRFAPDAIEMIYRASGGTPRVINRISDAALHQGYSRSANTIDADIVASALKHLAIDLPERQPVASIAKPVAAAPIMEPPPPELAEFDSETTGPSRTVTTRRPAPATMLALTGLALCAATLAASTWYRLQPADVSAREPLPAAPVRPRVAIAAAYAPAPPASIDVASRATAAGPAKYIIQVASFEDEERTRQLLAQLAGAGFRAYQTRFTLDGEPWWQVSAGPFATHSEAQAALESIRDIPGYDDAAIRVLNSVR